MLQEYIRPTYASKRLRPEAVLRPSQPHTGFFSSFSSYFLFFLALFPRSIFVSYFASSALSRPYIVSSSRSPLGHVFFLFFFSLYFEEKAAVCIFEYSVRNRGSVLVVKGLTCRRIYLSVRPDNPRSELLIIKCKSKLRRNEEVKNKSTA